MEARSTITAVAQIINVYPKPLTSFHHKLIYDDLGFSLIEKRTLKGAWRQLKPFVRRFGKEIFYTFLTKYELEIETFRMNDVLQVERLHGHAMAVMNFLDALIDVGLDDSSSFNIMISENFNVHSNVERESVILLAKSIKEYLLKELEPHSSETLRIAFKKLVEKLTSTRKINSYLLVNVESKSQIYGRMSSKQSAIIL